MSVNLWLLVFSDVHGNVGKGASDHVVRMTDYPPSSVNQMTAGGRFPNEDCVVADTISFFKDVAGLTEPAVVIEQDEGTGPQGTLFTGLQKCLSLFNVPSKLVHAHPPAGLYVMNPATGAVYAPNATAAIYAASQGAYVEALGAPPPPPPPSPPVTAPADREGDSMWLNRRVVLVPGTQDGYELDGWGGIHPIGAMPNARGAPYWPGWNIARDIALNPNGNGGFVLDGFGGIHPFAARGTAPAPASGYPYWNGWDVAVQLLIVDWASHAGYTIDCYGGMHPFNGAPRLRGGTYFAGNKP